MCLATALHTHRSRLLSENIPAKAQTTVRDVLAHFLRNPATVDSLEGIARWRVQQEMVPHIVEQVRLALRWLVDQRLVLHEERTGVASTFRLNPTRTAEAQRLLKILEQETSVAAAGPVDVASQRSERTTLAPPGDLLEKAVAWLDAVLLHHHRHQPSGGDLPGLTRSHASIETVLSTRVIKPATPEPPADDDLEAALKDAPDDDPLAALHRRLHLTSREFRAVLLSLAPEVDPKYQAVYGVLNDDLGRRTATLGLICAILGEPAAIRYELAESAGLTRWLLTDHGSSLPYADQPLRLDSALVAWILGDARALFDDPRLAGVLRTEAWPGADWIASATGRDLVPLLVDEFGAGGEGRWIVLEDGDIDASRASVEAASEQAGRHLLRVVLPTAVPADATDIAVRLQRAARLSSAVMTLDGALAGAEIATWLQHFTPAAATAVLVLPDLQPVAGVLADEDVRVIDIPPTDDAAGATGLAAAAASAGLRIRDEDARRLAMSFPLPVGGIDNGVSLALLEGVGFLEDALQPNALAAALRRVASPHLPRFARAVEPTFDLDSVVLPEDRHQQLREMVAHMRHQYQVLQTWGFRAQLPYGRGVTALFSGPSGTGKTMAAQAIAFELGTRAYLVDLSRVVSKYIGETEKQLDAVFNDAERAGAVLLFDEADALFGKRSEIRDSHDRYANIEVAYLLQRMEAFSGLAVLTTNLRRNLDEAFLRRLRFVVEFPKPDAAAREAI